MNLTHIIAIVDDALDCLKVCQIDTARALLEEAHSLFAEHAKETA